MHHGKSLKERFIMKFDPRDQLLWDFGWEVNRVILKRSNGG